MRLEHPGKVRQGILKGAKTDVLEFCEHCILAQQSKVKFGLAIHSIKGILEYIHSGV